LTLGRVRARGDIGRSETDGRFVSAYGESRSDTTRTDGRLHLDLVVGGGTSLSAGAEFVSERGGSTYVTGERGQTVPVERRVAGTYAELRAEPSRRLFVSAGVRAEHIRRLSLEGDPLAFQPRPRLGEDVVTSLNPRLAVAWFARPAESHGWTRVHASAGTGIRPPDVFEIAFTDNPSLRPERSRSVDAGVEHAMAGGRLVVDVTAFANRYDDLIVAVGRSFADASRFRTDNIANAKAAGIEASAALRAAWGGRLRAGYTLLATEVLAVDGGSGLAPPPFSPGDWLIRRPRHRLAIDALVSRSRWNAFVRLDSRSRVLDVDPSWGAFGGTLMAAGHGVVDAGGALRLGRRLEAFARVMNLLDETYEEALGYPAPGRHAVVGIRVAAGR
jgi:outer membrane receptor protein involved in Fe transport